jgi:uncharacterized repeat protein (TIGR01451 family)
VGYRTGNNGYISIHRGNLDAFAPQSEASFKAIGRGEFPSPFQLEAQTFAVPISPDFVAIGNFIGSGAKDLAVAAKGGNTLLIYPGDGKGGFGDPQTVNVADRVTALDAGEFGSSHMQVLAVGGARSVTIYVSLTQGLAALASYPLAAPVSNIVFGDFGDPGVDIAFLSNGKVQILRSANMRIATVPLPVSVHAFALGSFIPDRNPGPQLAVVVPDGSIQIAVHQEFDPRPYSTNEINVIRQAAPRGRPNPLLPGKSFPVNGWKMAEVFPGVANLSAGQSPVFFSTRVSSHGADDVVMVNAFSGQLVVISHADPRPEDSTFRSGEVSLRPYSGSVIAALPVRINVDGRPGIMAIHQGEIAPSMVMPIPDPTFFVNRFDDPVPTSPISNACNNTSSADTSSSCSLREAVIKANAIAGTDTIQLVAGTYTLTQARVSGDFTAQHGTLDVTDSVNIVGATDGSGNPASIIQACNPTPNSTCSTGVDKVFSFNQDISAFTNATVSISNLVIRFGHNRGTFGGLQDGFGGAFDFDTGGTTAGTGNANLVVTNCIITNNTTTDGDGGGVAVFNTNSGTGFAHFVNSTIQNNSPTRATSGAAGGGIFVGAPGRIVLDNTKIINNTATQTSPATGNGGGIFTFGQPDPSVSSAIHGSTISGNQAAGDGGGLNLDATITIDTGTVIANNQAGTAGGGATNGGNGGGILFSAQTGDSLTIAKATITGNSAAGGAGATPGGGGIWLGANQQTFNMHFSRLAGNTAPNGKNLDIPVVGGGSTLSATNNWWGTNAPASTITQGTANSITFDPFIVLTHTASPQTIRINQSTTLTGDMSKDNHGNGAALSGNLDEIVGLSITFDSPVLGTIPQAQPETLGNPVPTATATFNAGGTGGLGSANATVDQAIVPVDSNLIASATESGTTATITTVGAHNFIAGNQVTITGAGVNGYNGTFTITSVNPPTQFSYTVNASGLGNSSGGSASIGLVVLQPPSITKSFSPTTVALNTPSTITFSINNGNVVPINASFTDGLPANLVVASTPAVVNNCGGTVTATAGSNSISFSNNLLPAGVCTVQVNVQSAVDNTYSNSVTIDSTDAGNGNTSSANLTVISPPSITKTFGAALLPLNGTTTLSFAINNPNQNTTLNGLAFTDSLPAGLVVANPNSLNNTCGGTATGAAGSSSVTLAGASLAAGASCAVSVNVTGTTTGIKNNSVQITSTNGGTGNTSNASISVVGPPALTKTFGATSIPVNGSTSLSFTVQNGNSVALTGVGFSDTLPAGLIISTPNGLTGSCGSGTITATQNTNVISLSGATLAASTSCTFSVNVNGTAAGVQNNTTSAVSSNEGGNGSAASASITVVAAPSIAKAFDPSAISLGATTSLTFTIANPAANSVVLSGVAFTDTLPTGLSVASSTATVCGGTLTTTAPTGIALSGATIAANSQCQFSVTVTGSASGQYTNTTGAVTSTNGGTGNTASANLSVASPVSITKTFGAATIPLNGATTLSFAISNPNSSAASGVAFTDSLPAGLVVAATPNLSNTCGGTTSADAGSSTVSLSAGTVAASGSCAVSVNVTGTTPGVKNNSVQVSSSDGGTGNTSNASITVLSSPAITKTFGAASIPLNGTTTLSFTVQNPNSSTALTGVGFTDTLPAGLVISTPNGLTGSCGSGTITATQATKAISLSGATLAANTSCTFAVNVTGTAAGLQNNTTSGVTSNEGGTGVAASASITVVAPPSIAKAFTPNSVAVNATTTLGFTISNPAVNTVDLTGVAFTDVLPAGLTVVNGTTAACGGTVTTSGGNMISLSGATVAVNSSCIFSVPVTATQPGSFTNVTGNVTSTNGGTGNTATASLTVAGLTVTPTNINFGDVDRDLFAIQTVTITNSGSSSAPLTISLTPGTGGDADKFYFVSLCPPSLAPGQSCKVNVSFAPLLSPSVNLGISTATLNVTSGSTTQHVALQANVIDPEPRFSPTALSFGTHVVGSTTTQTIQVTNVGLTPLVINGVSVFGTNAGDFTASNVCTSPVAPGGSCQIQVAFTPKAKGKRVATLNIQSNDGPHFIPLSGTGK